MYEIELARDAQRYSDLCEAAEREDMAMLAAVEPVEHICAAIKAHKLTDAQLKRLIVVLSNQANACGCNEMAVAGLDDTGEIL